MNDNEIIQACKTQLERNRSISLEYVLKSTLKISPSTEKIRKIRNTILEDKQYIEEIRPDKFGNYRIKFNPLYEEKPWVERHWLLKEIIVAVITICATLFISFLLHSNQKDNDKQDKIETKKQSVGSLR